jgi:hypothetical protein
MSPEERAPRPSRGGPGYVRHAMRSVTWLVRSVASGSIFASVERLRELRHRVSQLMTIAEDTRQQLTMLTERLDELSTRMTATNERVGEVSRGVAGLRDEMAFFEDRAREESFRVEELCRRDDPRWQRDVLPSEETVRRVLEAVEANLPGLRAASRVDFSTSAVRDASMMSAARSYLGSRLTTRLEAESSCHAWVHWKIGRGQERPGLLDEAVDRLYTGGLLVLIVPAPAEALGGNPRLRLLAILDLAGEEPRTFQAVAWQRV